MKEDREVEAASGRWRRMGRWRRIREVEEDGEVEEGV